MRLGNKLLIAAARLTAIVGRRGSDELVAQGFTNEQVAQRLGISRFTAETHVRNILERLGAASRSEIATWATRDALADAPAGSGTRSHT